MAQRDVMAFDKADRVGLRALLWLAAAAVTIGYVVVPISQWLTDGPVHISFSGDATSRDLSPGLRVEQPGDLTLAVADPTTVDRVLSLLPGAVVLAATAIVVTLLLRMLRDLADGDPFRGRNVTRSRVIALAVGVGGLLTALLSSVVDAALLARHSDEAQLTFHLPVWPLITMLLVAAVAQVFASGSALRHDVAGLV